MGSDCRGEFGVGAVASGTIVALGTRGVIGVMERGTLGFNNTGDMGRTIETITLRVLRIPDKETGNCLRVKFP
ncbi:hypothetical protein HanHA300_Chr03g0107171 [Helianthus annuus]|nr:hypothetical protein HanHA300_Chr03g0107171 [Helianthus annuus]